jgi:hypothetical protein
MRRNAPQQFKNKRRKAIAGSARDAANEAD